MYMLDLSIVMYEGTYAPNHHLLHLPSAVLLLVTNTHVRPQRLALSIVSLTHTQVLPTQYPFAFAMSSLFFTHYTDMYSHISAVFTERQSRGRPVSLVYILLLLMYLLS